MRRRIVAAGPAQGPFELRDERNVAIHVARNGDTGVKQADASTLASAQECGGAPDLAVRDAQIEPAVAIGAV